MLAREFLNNPTWYYIGVEGVERRWSSGSLGFEAREAVKAFSGSNPRVEYGCFQSLQCSLSGERLIPKTHEAEIQAEDDVTKVRKHSADIMNESRSIRKWAPSRISLVKMSLGLTAPSVIASKLRR